MNVPRRRILSLNSLWARTFVAIPPGVFVFTLRFCIGAKGQLHPMMRGQ